jgi:hypothetical protein
LGFWLDVRRDDLSNAPASSNPTSLLETSVVESADGSDVFYLQTLRRPDGSLTAKCRSKAMSWIG